MDLKKFGYLEILGSDTGHDIQNTPILTIDFLDGPFS